MPPVEQSSVRVFAITPVKSMGKAMDIPVVSDTVTEVTRLGNNLSDYHHVKQARRVVEDGLKRIAEMERVKLITNNERVHKTVASVAEVVMPRVTSTVETLDTLAAGGIDSIKEACPKINQPTAQLVESTKDTASLYYNLATEYLASFRVAQISFSACDRALSMVEKTVRTVKPAKRNDGIISSTYHKIRNMRRSVRALRRAGSRRIKHDPESLSKVGLVGRLVAVLHINAFLGFLGLRLVVDRKKTPEKKSNGNNANESITEGTLEELKGDLKDYNSEEDPDYQPESSEDSMDEDSGDEGPISSSSEEEGEVTDEKEGKTPAVGEDGEKQIAEAPEKKEKHVEFELK